MIYLSTALVLLVALFVGIWMAVRMDKKIENEK